MVIFLLKPLVVGKTIVFSGMWNDALMHRDGLKGWINQQENTIIWSG